MSDLQSQDSKIRILVKESYYKKGIYRLEAFNSDRELNQFLRTMNDGTSWRYL